MAAQTQERKKVLIADDSQLNRELLAEILGDSYEYMYAEDGEQLLALLSKGIDADILLLDMHMPHMSGMEVLKVMKDRRWTEELPVVIISAESDLGYIQNALHLGALDYIQRPYNAHIVRHRVDSVLTIYARNRRLTRVVERQVQRQEKTNRMLFSILGQILETGDREPEGHILRVQRITRALLERLTELTDRYALTAEDISMISSVSALHDIGKMALPQTLLDQRDALTEEEQALMRSHTVKGDEMLWKLPIDQTEDLMVMARAVCRHHHERYDGTGYPDGLKGDEIPISAQTVALADAYDLLVGECCGKDASPYRQAADVLLRDERGAFNPLLLRCLADIADRLDQSLSEAESLDVNVIQKLAEEVREDLEEALPVGDRAAAIAEEERTKKEFFARQCGGIQFEYDAVARKLLSFTYRDEAGEQQSLTDATQLLELEDWNRLQDLIRQTTREQPTATMTALVPVRGEPRWHRMTARSVWGNESDSYVSIVGQFTDIHDEILHQADQLLVQGKRITGSALSGMRELFDMVRLVDPNTCQVLRVQEDGTVVPGERKCYEIWNRCESCQNCTSANALRNKEWTTKLESRDGRIFSVLSRYAECGGRDCVLEVALCMDTSGERKRDTVGFLPDSVTLEHYYRDTLTRAYSRAYLDHFQPNLENAKGVAVVDVDRFKQINDTFGHRMGDAALRHIVAVIRSCIRESDVLIRQGGDEFLLVFREIGKDVFFEKLRRIKLAVQESTLEEDPEMKLSVSIGGAYCVTPLASAIDEADKAMYRDKFQMRGH